MIASIQDIEELLLKKQSSKRFLHTRGVQYTSICLAMKYGEDLIKASYAGILHDCAKHFDGSKLLSRAEKEGLPINETEKISPMLLHGKVGAVIAKQKFGVEDEDILNAIRFHTTGRPGMTLLEKIVFTADYIEPGRNQAPDLAHLRMLAFTDLDACVVEILRQTLDYLKKTGSMIDMTTAETYEYYVNTDR